MAIVLKRAHALTEPVNRATDDSVLFERLIEKHQERLYRVAYRMAGNHDEAQDLLQDALIEAFRAFPSFRKAYLLLTGGLYRIMTRTFIDRQAQSRKRLRGNRIVGYDIWGGRLRRGWGARNRR